MLQGVSAVSLFNTLSESERKELSLYCQDRFIRANTLLFVEGDDASAMYIVKSGRLKVFHKNGEEEELLGYVNPDEFVGEMAFFDGEHASKRRMASVKSIEDTQLLVIMNYSIIDLAKKHKEIYDKIGEIIRRRKETNAGR